jgi:hypothetical protein
MATVEVAAAALWYLKPLKFLQTSGGRSSRVRPYATRLGVIEACELVRREMSVSSRDECEGAAFGIASSCIAS